MNCKATGRALKLLLLSIAGLTIFLCCSFLLIWMGRTFKIDALIYISGTVGMLIVCMFLRLFRGGAGGGGK